MYLSNTHPLKMLTSEPKMFWHMYVKWFMKIAVTKYTKHVFKPKKYAENDINSIISQMNEKIKNN